MDFSALLTEKSMIYSFAGFGASINWVSGWQMPGPVRLTRRLRYVRLM